jgi:hypothetical protein
VRKSKVRYYLELDHWETASVLFRVIKVRILRGPNVDGQYAVEKNGLHTLMHGDWLFETPGEAVEHRRKRTTERYEAEMAALAKALEFFGS